MRIGSLHRYWLAETNKRGPKGMLVGDYTGTSHAMAIEGLVRLGYVEIKGEPAPGLKLVVITKSGKRCLWEERKAK